MESTTAASVAGPGLAAAEGSEDLIKGKQRAGSRLQVTGGIRERGVATEGRGSGRKPPLPGMMDPAAKEEGVERSQPTSADDEAADEELKNSLLTQVLHVTSKVEEMERQVTEVNRMRASTKSTFSIKDRDKDKVRPGNKRQQQLEASRREEARARWTGELMRQFGIVLRQIMQHKWAWPFKDPVDVQGLGLHDYFEIIKKPMDLGTIRDRMDAKDGTGYTHIQEICDDVRLVFSNAMAYNQDGSDVHIMAKTLSERFEEKWKAALEPKLQEEEMKRKQEEREVDTKEAVALRVAEEAATEKLAVDVSRQLDDLDKQLGDLKQKATPRCRVMSTEDKRQLGHNLGRLPADNLQRVIQIIAQKNPGFNASEDEVEIDIDAQEPAMLWRLQRYVQSVMTDRKASASVQGSPPISTKRDAGIRDEKLGAKRSRRTGLQGSLPVSTKRDAGTPDEKLGGKRSRKVAAAAAPSDI